MKNQKAIAWLGPLVFTAVFASRSPTLQAQNVTTNGGFEDTGGTFVNNGQGYMDLPVGSTTIPGWKVTTDSLAWVIDGTPVGISTPYGSMFLDLTGTHDDNVFGGVTQTIATTPQLEYTLALSIGADQAVAAYAGTKAVSVSAGAANTTLTFIPTGTGNQWGTFSFNFTAASSSTVISIVGSSSGSGREYLGLDHVLVVPYLAGDANFDGIVNGQDIALVASNWLHTGVGGPGDVTYNGIVNGQDIALIASNWLHTSGGGAGSGAAVPEPSTLIVAAVGGLALLAWRRRRPLQPRA